MWRRNLPRRLPGKRQWFLPAEPEAEEVPQPEPLAQEEPEADLPFEKEPDRYLGEAFRTYLVVQQGESLFFIDKHAAHERILYNRLREQAHEESQQLLAPLNVSLSREEYAAVMDHEAELRQAGFEIEDFGGTTVLVRGIPMLLEGCDIAAAVQEIAGGLIGRPARDRHRADGVDLCLYRLPRRRQGGG